VSHVAPGRVRDKDAARRALKVYHQATERIYPRTAAAGARLLDGFELIEPEVMAGHARVAGDSGAVSTSPIGWRTLARKP
jgi:hypothetical protein